MANKNVNILLKLQDQFTGPMRQAGVITRDQEKAMRKVSSSVVGFSRNVRNGFLGGAAHVAKFGAALAGLGGALSVAGISRFLSDAEDLAKAQIEAETKLEAVLGNVKSIAAGGAEAVAAAKSELVGVASELQKVGVIGDEVTLAGMQQLATYQLDAEQITMLSKGMTDLLAQQKGLNATQEDAVSVANLIGKAMSGQTSALSRVGIIMDDNQKKMLEQGDATQRAAVLAEILQQNVGGVNEALAGTDQGRLQQLANNWGDMKEEVGRHVLSLKATLAAELVEYIPTIQDAAVKAVTAISGFVRKGVGWLKDHAEETKAGILKVKDGVATAWGYIKPVLGWAVQHASTLVPAVLGVVGAISAISVVADVAQGITGLVKGFKTLVSAAKGVKAILNVVSVAGFGPVGIAIGAVIAAGVLLYKHWDVIKPKLVALRDKFMEVFNRIKPVVLTVFEAIKTAGTALYRFWDEKLKPALAALRDVFVTAFNRIKAVAMPIIDAIRSGLEKLVAFIDKVKEGLSGLGFGSGNANLNENGFVSKDGNATGTPYWKGGPTYVNEGRRGEIINLPSGTQIIPHDLSEKAAGRGPSVTVNLTVQGNVVGSRQFMEQTGEYVARQVLSALEAV